MKKLTVKFIKNISLHGDNGEKYYVDCFEVQCGKKVFPFIELNGDVAFNNAMRLAGGAAAVKGLTEGLVKVSDDSEDELVANSHFDLAVFINGRITIVFYKNMTDKAGFSEEERLAVIAHEFQHCVDFSKGKEELGLKPEVRADTFASMVVGRKHMLSAIKKAIDNSLAHDLQPDFSIHRHRVHLLEVGFIRFISEKLVEAVKIKTERWFNLKLMSVTDIKLVCF